jgi:hypothetical protein
MFFLRQNAFVWLPNNHLLIAVHTFLSFPKGFCRFFAPVANNEVDESFSISVNSNLYPTKVFLIKNVFHLP